MNSPLLGGEGRRSKGFIIICVLVALISLFVIVSIGIGFYQASKGKELDHSKGDGLLAISLALSLTSFLGLFFFFVRGDLEGRVKFVIIPLLFANAMAGVAMNVYAWQPPPPTPPPPPPPINCNGLYQFSTGKCFTGMDLCISDSFDYCYNPMSMTCCYMPGYNCTTSVSDSFGLFDHS
eukprot:TRINITY_DN95_c5_g1_i1.p1 TRINITY_DN95_c5_g1~~TRINITY_DN95_c5_g1_i1.p1  ORF type:complete len:179 (-),score=11.43 TRINITY_DN95_c5_g1_i1:194-730(-)